MRLDPDLMGKAKDVGLDVNKFVENQLRKMLRANRCPVCGHTKPTEVPPKP
jgi:hypothetical protein